MKKNLYTWNDLIIVKINAPSFCLPGKIAVICGMVQIQSDEFELKIGDWIYTIEFGDGSSIEVPECYLEPYTNNE